MGTCPEDTEATLKGSHWPSQRQCEHQNNRNARLDKVGKHETILIEINEFENLMRNLVSKYFSECLLITKGKKE